MDYNKSNKIRTIKNAQAGIVPTWALTGYEKFLRQHAFIFVFKDFFAGGIGEASGRQRRVCTKPQSDIGGADEGGKAFLSHLKITVFSLFYVQV